VTADAAGCSRRFEADVVQRVSPWREADGVDAFEIDARIDAYRLDAAAARDDLHVLLAGDPRRPFSD
jgi:hypothetical protein